MQRRSLNAGGVTLAIILGLLTGPIVFYAFAGDYWHSTSVQVDQRLAGAVGAVLGIGALVNATRFRNAGLAGTITGLAAGVSELAVAVVPWIGFKPTHQACDANQICPLSPGDIQQIILVAGLFSIALFTIAGYSLTSLIVAVRARMR